MPRQARKQSSTRTYHVVIKGADRQLLFEDVDDYVKYLDFLAYYKQECQFELWAYCLMSNHVHLLIRHSNECVRDIPEEFALDANVIKAERKLGLRKSGHRGFDVITQTFFVEGNWLCKDASENLVSTLHKTIFDSFEEYYRFLDGDIYEDACYYQYIFDDKFSQSFRKVLILT